MMRVVCAEAVDVGEKRLGGKSVNAGIDFSFFLLRFSKSFLLDDGFHAITGTGADHAAITERIGRRGGKNRHSSFFAEMKIAQMGDCFRTNQRHVAGENK